MERGHHAVLAEARAGLGLVRATSFEERVLIAAQSVSAAGRALRPAADRARERVQGGQPIIRHQLIQAVPTDSATGLAVNRVLVYRGAWQIDRGGDPRTLDAQVAMAKVSATEAAGRVVHRGVQIFGGRGHVRDNAVERLCRDARVDRFRMGTSEVQRLMAAAEIDERGLSGPLRFATAPAGEDEPHTLRGPLMEGAAR